MGQVADKTSTCIAVVRDIICMYTWTNKKYYHKKCTNNRMHCVIQFSHHTKSFQWQVQFSCFFNVVDVLYVCVLISGDM